MFNVRLYELGISIGKNEFSLEIPRGSTVLGLRLTSLNARPMISVLVDEDETQTVTKRFFLATMEEPFEGPGVKLISCGSVSKFELFKIE